MVTVPWCNSFWGILRALTLHITRSQGFETLAMIRHDSGVMDWNVEWGCWWINVNETIRFLYQSNCKWRHFNALCHFFYQMFSLFQFFYPSPAMEQSSSVCVLSFPPFYVSFHLIPLLSTQALLQHINFFYFPPSFSLSPNQPIYIFFSSFFAMIRAPASLIIFHLFTFSLSLTQPCSLWCAPRPAFVLNLWKFMRDTSSYCITGWKCW